MGAREPYLTVRRYYGNHCIRVTRLFEHEPKITMHKPLFCLRSDDYRWSGKQFRDNEKFFLKPNIKSMYANTWHEDEAVLWD